MGVRVCCYGFPRHCPPRLCGAMRCDAMRHLPCPALPPSSSPLQTHSTASIHPHAAAKGGVNSVVVRFRGVGWRQESEIDDPFAFSEDEDEEEDEEEGEEEEEEEEEVEEDDLEDEFVDAIEEDEDNEEDGEKVQEQGDAAGTVINASADLHWILSWRWRIMALALVKRRQLEQVSWVEDPSRAREEERGGWRGVQQLALRAAVEDTKQQTCAPAIVEFRCSALLYSTPPSSAM